MLRFPNLFSSLSASSVLIAVISCDSHILNGLLQECNISFHFTRECNLQYVTTCGLSLHHSVGIIYSWLQYLDSDLDR